MTGASSAAVTARELKTINPATEEIINRHEIMTKEQIDDKVRKREVHFKFGRVISTKGQTFSMHLRRSFEKPKNTLLKLLLRKWEKR